MRWAASRTSTRWAGLRGKIPITFATFAIATAAIAGIPPLAGFFSKDEILWFAFASGFGGSPLLYAVAAGTALLTSLYMFRLLWRTFFGASRLSPEAAHHVHESPPSMTGILIVLAAAVRGRWLLRAAALSSSRCCRCLWCGPSSSPSKRRSFTFP
jgi:NADH:ubiquinone oxidoreductase subunit 5 (subunit L)/multisubunit Na+/H+ antiporter MnhA subunit